MRSYVHILFHSQVEGCFFYALTNLIAALAEAAIWHSALFCDYLLSTYRCPFTNKDKLVSCTVTYQVYYIILRDFSRSFSLIYSLRGLLPENGVYSDQMTRATIEVNRVFSEVSHFRRLRHVLNPKTLIRREINVLYRG